MIQHVHSSWGKDNRLCAPKASKCHFSPFLQITLYETYQSRQQQHATLQLTLKHERTCRQIQLIWSLKTIILLLCNLHVYIRLCAAAGFRRWNDLIKGFFSFFWDSVCSLFIFSHILPPNITAPPCDLSELLTMHQQTSLLRLILEKQMSTKTSSGCHFKLILNPCIKD